MPPLKSTRKTDASSVVSAGAAGGGIGTVLAAMANNLPAGSSWKTTLTVLSPLITVSVGGVWLFIKACYIDRFVNKQKYRASDRAMEDIIGQARANADAVNNDPASSEAHRQAARATVEKLEKLRMEKVAERLMEVEPLD